MQKSVEELFGRWYPLTVDNQHGGYYSDLSFDWKLDGPQDKMIVTQARHVWSLSSYAEFHHDASCLQIAGHGFTFIVECMLDHTRGGVYWLVNRAGKPIKEQGQVIKRAYGIAFVIYGMAAYARVSKSSDPLKTARQLFQWMEEHLHDQEHGGYFQFSDQEGNVLQDGFGGEPPKDQNSSIHILEAFTELYRVWPDPLLKLRIEEMIILIRDKLTSAQGYLRLFFDAGWNHVDYNTTQDYSLDHVSFGHDIETAYLLIEASEVIGNFERDKTWDMARKMVNHSIEYGWDAETGSLFDGGFYHNSEGPEIIMPEKTWWSQAEAMNTLLIFGDHFPEDSHEYHRKFESIWNYIKEFIIDREQGGWFWGGVDEQPDMKTFPKGSIWKGTYHNARALMNCIKRLRSE